MTPRSLVGGIRKKVLTIVGRSDRASAALTGFAASIAIRLGADRRVLDDLTVTTRPLNRSLQLVQWSMAATGRGPFPRHFAPGDHLVSHASREAAVEILRRRPPSADTELQLIGLDDTSLDTTLSAIENDLRSRLTAAATVPKRGDGLDSTLQTALVVDVTSALARDDLHPFLMSGTLLGLIRDGTFMEHDHDIDIGLLPGDDVDQAIASLEVLGGFEVEVAGGRVAATHRSGVVVDVFPHELRDGLFWHSTKIHEWWNTPFDVTERELAGVRFPIPDDPERYLDENYGAWSRPVPFFDISFDTPNRQYIECLDTVRFLHSRCRRALDNGDRWLLESAARELRTRSAST